MKTKTLSNRTLQNAIDTGRWMRTGEIVDTLNSFGHADKRIGSDDYWKWSRCDPAKRTQLLNNSLYKRSAPGILVATHEGHRLYYRFRTTGEVPLAISLMPSGAVLIRSIYSSKSIATINIKPNELA